VGEKAVWRILRAGLKRMKILYLIPMDIWTEPWAIRALKICENLCARGHEITLFYFWNQCKRLSAPVVLHTLPDGVGVKTFPLWNVWYDTFSPRLFMRLLSDIRSMARDADLIHVQKALPWAALPAVLASQLENKALHYDWDDNESAIASEYAPVLFTAEIKLYETLLPFMADTISVSTTSLRKKLLRWGFPEHRVFDAPVGADLRVFYPRLKGSSIKEKLKLKKNVVLYMGQIEWGSYAECFIDSYPVVAREIGDVSFLVVGGGEKLAQLKKRAEGLGTRGGVVFTGYVNREIVPDYVACCDVAVACFPDNEVTRCKSPLKIAEYMAAGKAIVASDVGDVPRMLGRGGILARPGDANDLADKIVLLLKDSRLREALGNEGRRRAELIYNWENTAARIEEAHTLAIRGRR